MARQANPKALGPIVFDEIDPIDEWIINPNNLDENELVFEGKNHTCSWWMRGEYHMLRLGENQ